MNIIIQRFSASHPLYTDAKDSSGLQAITGQMIDEKGELICYTLERRDTLIPAGTYPFIFYNSPANRMKVPLLQNVPNFEDIEIHVANYPHDLKGCTAVGSAIDVSIPMVTGSVNAFNKLMNLLNGQTGTATYQNLEP